MSCIKFTVLANTSAWPSNQWAVSSATICICNTTTATYTYRQITLTRFVNTSAETSRPSIAWVVQTLRAQNREYAVQSAKSLKNSSCSISVAFLPWVTRFHQTPRGKTKWKRRFLLLKPPTNASQSPTPKPTWSAKYQWIVLSAAMSVSAKQRSQFALRLNAFKTANKSPFSYPQHCLHRNTVQRLQHGLPVTRFASKSCLVS